MSKHRRKQQKGQEEGYRTITVELPTGLLGTLKHARNALFELCIETGRQILAKLTEEDRTMLRAAKGQHQSERGAYRYGSSPSEVTLDSRRMPIMLPRVRSIYGKKLALPR
jgi:hypothetical protein